MEKLLYALQTEAKHLTAYRCSDSNETPNKHVNRTLRRAQANIEFGVDINCCCFSICVFVFAFTYVKCKQTHNKLICGPLQCICAIVQFVGCTISN